MRTTYLICCSLEGAEPCLSWMDFNLQFERFQGHDLFHVFWKNNAFVSLLKSLGTPFCHSRANHHQEKHHRSNIPMPDLCLPLLSMHATLKVTYKSGPSTFNYVLVTSILQIAILCYFHMTFLASILRSTTVDI
jgi:hypothetical protein